MFNVTNTKGANVNEKGSNGITPLMLATYGQSSEVMTELLKNGAEIDCTEDDSGETPLMRAVKTG